MLKFLAAPLIAISFAISAPAMAKNGFQTTVSEPLLTAVKVEVVVGEDLAYRANNLPRKTSARTTSRRLNRGFESNGHYGDREIERLIAKLQTKIAIKFNKKGIEISDDAPTILRVTITDAIPNRPTFEQQSRDVGLSLQSISTGGAKIESELIAADGRSLGTLNYSYYENDIRDSQFGSTWNDAYDAFRRYAHRAAKTLS